MSDELNNLDNLEKKLNTPKAKGFDVHARPLRRNIDDVGLPTSWGNQNQIISNNQEIEMGMPFSLKLFLGSLFILVLVLSYTGYRVYSSKNIVSSANIGVSVSVDPYIEGGELVPVSVEISNNNSIPLQDAVLTLSYQRGVSSQNETEEVSEKRNIGVLVKDSLARQEFKVQIYGGESEAKNINAKLEYKVSGSNAVYSKIISVSTIIKTPPISVHVNGPDSLVQGQSGTYTFNIKNNTSSTTEPFMVLVSVPYSFKVNATTPRLTGKKLIWKIDKLDLGEEATVTLTGSFVSNAGDKTSINVAVGSGNSNDISMVYSSDIKDVSISNSPLKLSMGLTTDRGSVNVLRYGDMSSVVLGYENVSEDILTNVEVMAQISGTAPVIDGIKDDGRGYYDSQKQNIIWSKLTFSDFAVLQPHAKGALQFFVPIVTKGNNTPDLHLEITGNASDASSNVISTNLSDDWLVKGSATLNGSVSYKNSSFVNSGPVPPVANVDTTYTLHLVASAQNQIESAKVSFILPIYVSWKSVFTAGANISFDPSNRTVVWDIGAITSNQTVGADIQVSVRPSVSHIGLSPNITSGITFEGFETDTNSTIKTSISPLTTNVTGEGWQDISRVVGQ